MTPREIERSIARTTAATLVVYIVLFVYVWTAVVTFTTLAGVALFLVGLVAYVFLFDALLDHADGSRPLAGGVER